MSPTSKPATAFVSSAFERTPSHIRQLTARRRRFQSPKSCDPLFRRYKRIPSLPYPTPQHSHAYHPVRSISTTATLKASPPIPEASTLSAESYHTISDAYIETLVAQLEELQEEREDVDVEYSVLDPISFPLPPPKTINVQQADHTIFRQAS